MVTGRPPKPAKIKALEGNREKLGRARIRENPAALGLPRLPTHLSQEERRLWADVLASLPPKLLTRADEGVLERFAVAWAEFREVHATITRTGRLVQSANGPVRNPLLVVRNAAAKEMHLAGMEIGLSPVARARLTAEDREEDDPMALLLGEDLDPNGAWSTTRN